MVPSGLWHEVVGDEPEHSVKQRALSLTSDSGRFVDGALTLNIVPSRVDWIYEAVGVRTDGGVPALLGPFPSAAAPLIQIGCRWATKASFPPTYRIALGATLFSPVSSREAGYRELSNFVAGVPDPGEASDFQYQVNYPRRSRVGSQDLLVNRLAKWSVNAVRLGIIGPGGMAAALGEIKSHLSLELDINTSGDRESPIPQEEIGDIVRDLLDGAKEVVAGRRIAQ
jgi:hypothetical protein